VTPRGGEEEEESRSGEEEDWKRNRTGGRRAVAQWRSRAGRRKLRG
jgi:hypothetical protein